MSAAASAKPGPLSGTAVVLPITKCIFVQVVTARSPDSALTEVNPQDVRRLPQCNRKL